MFLTHFDVVQIIRSVKNKLFINCLFIRVSITSYCEWTMEMYFHFHIISYRPFTHVINLENYFFSFVNQIFYFSHWKFSYSSLNSIFSRQPIECYQIGVWNENYYNAVTTLMYMDIFVASAKISFSVVCWYQPRRPIISIYS